MAALGPAPGVPDKKPQRTCCHRNLSSGFGPTASNDPSSAVKPGQRLERDLTDRRRSITFMGKLFYLDLPHTKQNQLLTKAICSRGGVIESFLSRDVDYMVTGSKKAADSTNGDSSDRNVSQRRPKENLEKTPYSRGKQLLKKVVQSQECSSILASARSWGVSILHVDEVLEHLEGSTQRRAGKPPVGKGPGGAGRPLKVGKLKSPFLKIEDQSRKYRPLHCSFSNFPECSLISSDRSPFETARTNNSTHKDRELGDPEECEKPQNWEKSGYCECCRMTYTKLSEHMISEQHCLFALNASNYRVIDDITSRINYDFVPLPHGFNPIEERCEDEAPLQCLEETPLTEEECLEKEAAGEGESKDLMVDLGVECPMEEQNLVLPERQHIMQDAEHPIENDSLPLSKDPPAENLVIDEAQEHVGGLLVEDNGPPCTTNALVQSDLPLQAVEGSHVGLVTEVSWYTEVEGLTSVYTVQSLVIPPVNVLDQHPEMDMEDASVRPPLLLSALGEPPCALAQGGFKGPDDDLTPSALHQTNALLAAEPQPTAGLHSEPSPAPTTVSESTLQHLEPPSGAEVPVVESAVDPHPHVLLVSTQSNLLMNTPCELPTELANNLAIDQLTLAPWPPSAEDNVTLSTAPLGRLVDAQDPEPVVPTEDWSDGKRKHCWSPCHPPAKRPPLHCQPMWAFHQLPSTMNQPTTPVFSDWVERDGGNKACDEGTSPPTFCFNPLVAQYEASSESDWDTQLASQRHNNPHQTAHFGELRTAQVSLDESWYGKQLCSALAHEQTLGSPSATQTVTLSHTSYDLYLGGVAS